MTKDYAKDIIKVPADEELARQMLRYSYSVVYSRAIPFIDGFKPVARRILFGCLDSGWTSDKPFVKVSRIAGQVMGRLHPHGDASISDALVKLAQPFYLNTPMMEGYGNFGDITGSQAAAGRYIEARLSKAGELMLADIKEDGVPMKPNYDGTMEEPTIVPVPVPTLLIQGNFGIGVGYASKLPPHNEDEVIEATKYVLKNPKATLDDVMKFIQGPDFPTGAEIIGADGIRELYETGKGTFRLRAKATISQGLRGKHEIVFSELPYGVSTESVIAKIKDLLKEGKLTGLYDAKDLSDRKSGLRLVVETKAGANPQVVLAELYKDTPLEDTFAGNNTIILDGGPKQVGLLEIIHLFIAFRRDVVTRRSKFRKAKREQRLHLVDGLLKALANIDDVIKIVRAATDATVAQQGLIKKFKIDELQADYILGIPLRRLTKYDTIQLQDEKKKLEAEIAELTEILNNPKKLDTVIIKDMEEVRKVITHPRRSLIVGGTLAEHVEAVKETVAAVATGGDVADEPCYLYLTPRYGVIRSATPRKQPARSVISTTTRGRFVAVTNKGRGFRIDNILVGAKEAKVDTVLPDRLGRGEVVVTIVPENLDKGKAGGIAIGTRKGVVKITAPQWPVRSDDFTVINLDNGDEIVNAGWVSDVSAYDFVFVTDKAALLTFPADKVRPQGLTGAGMAGIKLPDGGEVVAFSIVERATQGQHVLVSATDQSIRAVKFSPELFPQKGRGTGGYSVHSFLKGEEKLAIAGVTLDGVLFSAGGKIVPLPALSDKRTSSGTKFDNSLF